MLPANTLTYLIHQLFGDAKLARNGSVASLIGSDCQHIGLAQLGHTMVFTELVRTMLYSVFAVFAIRSPAKILWPVVIPNSVVVAHLLRSIWEAVKRESYEAMDRDIPSGPYVDVLVAGTEVSDFPDPSFDEGGKTFSSWMMDDPIGASDATKTGCFKVIKSRYFLPDFFHTQPPFAGLLRAMGARQPTRKSVFGLDTLAALEGV